MKILGAYPISLFLYCHSRLYRPERMRLGHSALQAFAHANFALFLSVLPLSHPNLSLTPSFLREAWDLFYLPRTLRMLSFGAREALLPFEVILYECRRCGATHLYRQQYVSLTPHL